MLSSAGRFCRCLSTAVTSYPSFGDQSPTQGEKGRQGGIKSGKSKPFASPAGKRARAFVLCLVLQQCAFSARDTITNSVLFFFLI